MSQVLDPENGASVAPVAISGNISFFDCIAQQTPAHQGLIWANLGEAYDAYRETQDTRAAQTRFIECMAEDGIALAPSCLDKLTPATRQLIRESDEFAEWLGQIATWKTEDARKFGAWENTFLRFCDFHQCHGGKHLPFFLALELFESVVHAANIENDTRAEEWGLSVSEFAELVTIGNDILRIWQKQQTRYRTADEDRRIRAILEAYPVEAREDFIAKLEADAKANNATEGGTTNG